LRLRLRELVGVRIDGKKKGLAVGYMMLSVDRKKETKIGSGDDILATGMARGAAARRKRVAFGDGRRIIWGPYSAEMFKGNPNIAPPGSEGASDLEWVGFYKGNRLYNRLDGDRWVWNMDFRASPGEFYFTEREQRFADFVGFPSVIIEPNVPQQKLCAPNKQWPVDRYEVVAREMIRCGLRVLQFHYKGMRHILRDATPVHTPSLRSAAAVLAATKGYIGAEGGLHHCAAAVGVPAVVIFGGWIPPQVTGYEGHANLAVGEACGKLRECAHCREAMDKITVEQVLEAAARVFIS
jgi:Glycosyltransferase family 9 (heptosyltransferase)